MTFNRFAAGKKVYGQGSFAPTRGTVDPSGYIKRELRRRSLNRGGIKPIRSWARPITAQRSSMQRVWTQQRAIPRNPQPPVGPRKAPAGPVMFVPPNPAQENVKRVQGLIRTGKGIK